MLKPAGTLSSPFPTVLLPSKGSSTQDECWLWPGYLRHGSPIGSVMSAATSRPDSVAHRHLAGECETLAPIVHLACSNGMTSPANGVPAVTCVATTRGHDHSQGCALI